jgi:hypothetical protein
MDKFEVYLALKCRAKECDNKGDDKEFMTIADLVINNKLKDAYKYWQKMDTYLRETTPDEVYSYLLLNRTGADDRKIVELKMKLNSKVVYNATVEYPSDACNDDIAVSIVRTESDIIKKLITFEYSEPVIVKKTEK